MNATRKEWPLALFLLYRNFQFRSVKFKSQCKFAEIGELNEYVKLELPQDFVNGGGWAWRRSRRRRTEEEEEEEEVVQVQVVKEECLKWQYHLMFLTVTISVQSLPLSDSLHQTTGPSW